LDHPRFCAHGRTTSRDSFKEKKGQPDDGNGENSDDAFLHKQSLPPTSHVVRDRVTKVKLLPG
jgi:hypothetical protein